MATTAELIRPEATAIQVTLLQEPFAGIKCSVCGEGVHLHEERSMTPNGWAHWDCAGVEGLLASCPNCFMIVSDCSC